MSAASVAPSYVEEGKLLWTPSAAFTESSQLRQFERWLAAKRDLRFADFDALWRWSVTQPEAFWGALWDYFEIESATPYTSVVSGAMPRARWFTGCRLNYAEHVLRHERVAAPDEVAIVHQSELRDRAVVTWHELGSAVRVLAC